MLSVGRQNCAKHWFSEKFSGVCMGFVEWKLHLLISVKTKRWGTAAAGVFMQLALGAVYAWSVFRIPLAKQFGWSIPEVTLTFTVSIFVLGVSAFFGGLWLNRSGPRLVAMTGGLLYGAGVFLASLCAGELRLLYLTYWLIVGVGMGCGVLRAVVVWAARCFVCGGVL